MAGVGIFPGTFDPIHSGHIAFCVAALAAGNLEKVVLLPEPKPHGKPRVAPLEHRQAMIALAAAGHPRLEVLALPGQQFSVAKTLPQLQHYFAGARLSLLIGSDVVRTFAYRWPDLETLLAELELLIALRSSDTQQGVENHMQAVQETVPAVRVRYQLIGSPHARASSSRIRADGSAAGLELAPSVATYIAAHRLYAGSV